MNCPQCKCPENTRDCGCLGILPNGDPEGCFCIGDCKCNCHIIVARKAAELFKAGYGFGRHVDGTVDESRPQ